jgi:hypothetical protein
MNSPQSDQFLPRDDHNPMEVGRARGLLKLSLTDKPRPIDELLHQLEQPNGRVWLLNAMPAHIDRAELMHLIHGKLPLYAIIERKDRSKTSIVEAETTDAAMAALAVYCLCVASAIVHFNQLISTQSWRTWQAFLADLADVAPEDWRVLLFNAAVKVEHAHTYAA